MWPNQQLLILDEMSTFKSPFSQDLHKVLCLILGVLQDQTNSFWTFFSSKIVAFGIAVTKARGTVFDKVDVLKIVILFLICHKLRVFLMLIMRFMR